MTTNNNSFSQHSIKIKFRFHVETLFFRLSFFLFWFNSEFFFLYRSFPLELINSHNSLLTVFFNRLHEYMWTYTGHASFLVFFFMRSRARANTQTHAHTHTPDLECFNTLFDNGMNYIVCIVLKKKKHNII